MDAPPFDKEPPIDMTGAAGPAPAAPALKPATWAFAGATPNVDNGFNTYRPAS